LIWETEDNAWRWPNSQIHWSWESRHLPRTAESNQISSISITIFKVSHVLVDTENLEWNKKPRYTLMPRQWRRNVDGVEYYNGINSQRKSRTHPLKKVRAIMPTLKKKMNTPTVGKTNSSSQPSTETYSNCLNAQ
jgi:hypothetical protein